MIKKKVGSITLAVGLITVGALLFAQNFMDIPVKDIYRYWPVLLIGLGLEMVLYMVLYGRGNNEVKLSVDGLCIVFIIVLGLISNGVRFMNIDAPGRMFFGYNGSSIIDGVKYRNQITEAYTRDNISGSFDIKELKVTNNFGRLKVLPTDAESIRVEAEVTVKNNDEAKAREYIKNAVEIKEGEVTEISPLNPVNWDKKDYSKAQIDFVIYVPKQINLDARGSFGDISAEGIGGKCTIENKNGEINAENIGGDLSVVNSFGDIEVNNVGGKADLTNSFGDINIARANGGIIVENQNGRIEAESVTGNAQIKNSFGDIYFKSASLNDGDIYAKTKFGNIDSEKPLQLNKEGQDTVAQGRLGSAQYKIELITNNGNISIE